MPNPENKISNPEISNPETSIGKNLETTLGSMPKEVLKGVRKVFQTIREQV